MSECSAVSSSSSLAQASLQQNELQTSKIKLYKPLKDARYALLFEVWQDSTGNCLWQICDTQSAFLSLLKWTFLTPDSEIKSGWWLLKGEKAAEEDCFQRFRIDYCKIPL